MRKTRRSDTAKLYKHRRWLESGHVEELYCTICVAKTKELISCAVTAQLICAFFSHMQSVGFLMRFFLICTLKKSYKRPPHIFSSSSESKIRSI